METDLSLIEIVGEDDSLLQQIVNGEDDDNNNNHSDVSLDIDFSCSPLQALRSKRSADRLRIPPAEVSEVNEERKKSRSPPDDIDSKENINESNSLVTNFTEEPQQMKRRRKGGGYNLRKSLAWNRAFFTEDGVLDPAELSLLSGSFVKSSSEYLPSVHEEELESLSECSDLSGDGSLLQSVEENLFKELPARSGNEDQKVASSLLLKSKASGREAAAPMHAASRKVQLAKGINRSVSQGEGCTRPSGSTSQKRLPNRNTTNSTAKDSKLPRYPALKPSSVPMTSKTVILGTKHSKCNQNGPPVINIESNAGFKGSSNNTKNAPACTSTSSKSSVHRSGKTLANLPLGTHLLANSQPPRVRKGTSTGLKVIPAPTPPAADMQAPTSHAGPGKIAVPLPQTSYCVGKNMQYANSQPTKPSGLRLPSPSLRFFDQPKASALHSVKSQRNTQPCKLPESNIPNVRSDHIGEVKPLNAPWSLPKVSADATTTKTMGVLGSTFGCSTPSVTSATHPTPKSNLGMKNLQKVEMEVSSIPNSSYSQVNGSQLQLLGVPDGVDEQSRKLADALRPNPDEVGCNPLKHNLRSQMNNDTLLVQIESSEHAQKVNDLENASDICSSLSALESSHAVPQPRSAMVVKEGVAGTDDMIKQPKLEHARLELIKGKPLIEKHDICSEMQSGDALESCSTGTPMVHKDDLLVTHDFAGKADEQAELRKQGPDEVKVISYKNSLRLEMNDSNLIDGRSSEEFQTEYDLEHITNVDPGIRDSGGSLLESTHVLSQLSSAIEVEEGAAEVDKVIKNLHAQNAQLEPLISNSSVENYNLICDSQRDATDNHSSDTLMVNVNCLRVGDNVDEQSGEHPEIRNPCPNEVEQILHKDYCTLQMTDKALLAEKRSEESQQDNNLENSINVTLKRKDSSESESRSSHVVSQQISAIQIKEGSAGVDNMFNHSHLEEAVLESLNVNLSANSNFIPEGTETDLPHNSEISDSTEFQQDTNLENANSVTSERRESFASKPESSHVPSQLIPAIQVKEDFAGVDNMTEHSHIEDAAQESSNVDLSAKSNVLPNIETDLPHNSKILDGTESQHNDDLKNIINVTPERRDSSASALKCSHVLSPLMLAKRSKEGSARLDNMTDHSHLKDAALGSLKINLSADSIVYSENTETDLPHSSKTSDGELQCEIKNGEFPSEVKGARISANKKSMDDSKQDSPLVKYQMNAVPFTDEWLAALEAAGEEILTRKSGAVQNSPPDKPLLEPSPWSPVKRKSDQEIGPFDCTKYTNLASNSQ